MARPAPQSPDDMELRLQALLDPDHDGPAPALDDLAARRWTDEVLARAERPPAIPEGPASRRPWIAAGGFAVVAAAAAFLLWGGSGSVPVPAPAAPEVAAVTPAANPAVEPPVTIPEPATKIQVPAGEPLTMEPGPGVELSLGGGTLASLRRPEGGVALEIERGWVRAEVVPGSQRIPFRVHTPHGTVEVIGTVFEVESNPDTTDVRVRRGKVRVTESSGTERLVEAGQGLTIGAQVRALDPEPSDAALPVPSGRRQAADPSTPDELMTRAASARAERDWKAAADQYARVRRRFGASPQACTARVSEAVIRMDHLGQASRALALLDDYHASCGQTLREEAAYGRTRALRKLGRTSAEHRALVEFTERYPGSVKGPAVRLRLADLLRAKGACTEATPIYRALLKARPGARISKAAGRGVAECELGSAGGG